MWIWGKGFRDFVCATSSGELGDDRESNIRIPLNGTHDYSSTCLGKINLSLIHI